MGDLGMQVFVRLCPSPQIGFSGLQGLDKSPLKYIGFIPLDS